jgi:type IV pilus assembly protein PilA
MKRPPARDADVSIHAAGFSILEVLAVVAVIAILATLATPGILERIVRQQIKDALPLADIAKKPIAAEWAGAQTLPADNAAAGLPVADKIVATYVQSLVVTDGTINITLGNQASGAIKGKLLTLRPAVVEDEPIVPVSWVCGHSATPDKMTVKGTDLTNIEDRLLPVECRP